MTSDKYWALESARHKYGKGDRARAREILIALLRTNHRIPEAWLLLSKCLEDPEKQLDCINMVLQLDPDNQEAKNQRKRLQGEIAVESSDEEADEPLQEQVEDQEDRERERESRQEFTIASDEAGRTVHERLETARKELLDLGLRNTLLNYRTLKSRGVEIVDEKPQEVYRILVAEGRRMSFLSAPEEEETPDAELFDEEEELEAQILLQQPEEDAKPADRHVDNKLQTPYKSSLLQKRLLSTEHAAKTSLEEQGVNILYIALGMLEWFESPNSEIARKAPLILIPVQLTRTDVQARFRVSCTGDDVGGNLSLRAKIKNDFGIEIPEISDPDDIDVSGYLDEIRDAIRNRERWVVREDAIVLGFFSFSKFLMFHDLDAKNWPEDNQPHEHPLVGALLKDGFQEASPQILEEHSVDDLISPREVSHVVDADSSQMLAILEVNNGNNLVIQGPPGTGKSQTITNLIAEAIGDDKKVLFVSEKMAALEVVKRRLDAVGIGDACLELHSDKTAKKSVIDELRRTLSLGKPMASGTLRDMEVLIDSRARLNEYAGAVNTVIGESGYTPYHAYGVLLELADELPRDETPHLRIDDISQWSGDTYGRRRALVQELQSLAAKIGVPKQHPFWGSEATVITPAKISSIRHEMKEARDQTLALEQSVGRLAEYFGVQSPQSIIDVPELLDEAKRVLKAPDLTGLQIKTTAWLDDDGRIGELISAGRAATSLRSELDGVVKDDAWGWDVEATRKIVEEHGRKLFRVLSSDFRRSQRSMTKICVGSPPRRHARQMQILTSIQESQRLEAFLSEEEEFARELFGEHYSGIDTDWEFCLAAREWLRDMHSVVEDGTASKSLLISIENDPDHSDLRRLIEEVQERKDKQKQALERALAVAEIEEQVLRGERLDSQDLSFDRQVDQLEAWIDNSSLIQEIAQFNHMARRLQDECMEPVLEAALDWPEAGSYLVNLFRKCWFEALIDRAFNERAILASFSGDAHEQKIRSFCELDSLLLEVNRPRLAQKHWKELPRDYSAGQIGILLREFEKKRRHLPIRSLMEQAGRAIQAIKPIFMMSPLSVAKYLPPGSITFDMVIFDEASQIKPVDALGAILRADQAVVVGDNRQLPPTTFFDSVIEDEEQESPTSDLESILGLFSAQGAPRKMLRWHYRSQHESLIAVSNYEFYENSLVVFPSPDAERHDVGLVFHHLPDTVYDRGKSRTNKEEARAVAEAVMDHAGKNPGLTLGVAAFSASQMKAIIDQLEIRRRLDPSNEPFFSDHPEEPFFVKNLENVQGDERDVIFISVGYGRSAGGKVSMNFGPINQQGGERRLNVLITRARRRCEVFANIVADDIDLSRSQARGVIALKRFLKYAETGDIDIPVPTNGDADSPFEMAVATALRDRGYRVEHQVGTAGFFVDLAIVDKDQPGRYILGIECDGASYHSARAARDRDRLRQEVLERMGWRIHRIWSTDWFRFPERELKKTIETIERAKYKAKFRNNDQTPSRGSGGANRSIKRAESKPLVPEKNISVDRYQYAGPQVPLRGRDLHEISPDRFASWISSVVVVESPVHVDEVARRIADAAGVKRIGSRIQALFNRGVRTAVRNGQVEKKGDFLWNPKMEKPILRDRSGLENRSRQFDYICPEELAEGILLIAEKTFGIGREEAASEVCGLLGFSRTSANMSERVEMVIDELVRGGRLIQEGHSLMVPEG